MKVNEVQRNAQQDIISNHQPLIDDHVGGDYQADSKDAVTVSRTIPGGFS
jgi:hypothetical protein